MKLELKKFDLKEIPHGATCVFSGKRCSGKSVAALDLLYYNRDIPVGLVMSGTERANQFFSKVMPSMLIYDDFDPEVIKKFLTRQEKITRQYNDEISKYGKSDIDPRAFLILDDLLFDNSWISDKGIKYIFMNGRHLNILFMVTLQYPLGIPPILRTNIDYVFIHRENFVNNRRRLYENYAGMFPTFESFSTVLDQTTTNFECMVINNRTKSNRLEEQINWFKAELRSNFKVCSQVFWDMEALNKERKSQKNYKGDEDDDEEDYDPASSRKKNALQIRVAKR
jgi:hypothetical protein